MNTSPYPHKETPQAFNTKRFSQILSSEEERRTVKSKMKYVCILLGVLCFAQGISAQPKLMWYNSCNNDAKLLKDGGAMSSGSASYVAGYVNNAYQSVEIHKES